MPDDGQPVAEYIMGIQASDRYAKDCREAGVLTMNRQAVARELVAVAKMLMAEPERDRHVEVKLDDERHDTVKKVKMPDSIYKDTVKRNEFARKYFKSLGYDKIEIGRWS